MHSRAAGAEADDGTVTKFLPLRDAATVRNRMEEQVLAALSKELTTDAIVKQAASLARAAAAPGAVEAELNTLRRQADELARKIERVRGVMTIMDKPEAMAPKLVELTERKKSVEEKLALIADQVAQSRVMRTISEEDVRRILGNLVARIGELGRAELKARLRVLLARSSSTRAT